MGIPSTELRPWCPWGLWMLTSGVEAAGGVAGLTLRIESRCLPRVELVSATSLWATKHLTGTQPLEASGRPCSDGGDA